MDKRGPVPWSGGGSTGGTSGLQGQLSVESALEKSFLYPLEEDKVEHGVERKKVEKKRRGEG